MKTSLAQTAKAVTFQNAHPEAVWGPVNEAVNEAVDLPVRRAVDSAVWGPVHEAVHWAMYWPVESAVGSAVYRAVSGTLDL